MSSILINDEQSLAEFRATRFLASAIAPIIMGSDITLINTPIGTGKSFLLDNLLEYFSANPIFDLIVVLAALTANLLERRLVRHPTQEVRRLRPRPSVDCGPLDPDWRSHERGGTTAFAKHSLCRSCPHFGGCFWPTQYGKALKGARIIFGTHQHLLNNPHFLWHLQSMTEAESMLLLLDEADVLASPFRTTLTRQVLSLFMEAVSQADIPEKMRGLWLEQTALLTVASTADVRSPGWSFPRPTLAHSLAVQTAGLALDSNFQWPGHNLYAFSRTRTDQRWKDRNGDVVFVRAPYLACRTAIFSAGMSAEYVARQLRVDRVVTPFTDVQCQHQDTQFYNLCSLIGAAKRFYGNRIQILDFFAQLIIRNIAAGHSTLLIARKRLKRLCAEYLEHRLSSWGHRVTVFLSDGQSPPEAGVSVLPLIHFGINGVNTFESYDSVYCLCGYYIDEQVLRDAIADVEPDELRFPVLIRVTGQPRRRLAATFVEQLRFSNADEIVRDYYRQLETNTVIQAVGRVRFATKPREVITFQYSEMSDVHLAREFYSLREARDHFGLVTGSDFERHRQAAEAMRLRAEGLTTAAIAERLGVCKRTVGYRLKSGQRVTQ
jgi:hypothetical protein